MSSTVPKFVVGERFQVMNTTTSSEMGLQNLLGTIITEHPGQAPTVELDRGDIMALSASQLVHITPEDEARWAKNQERDGNEL